MLPACASPKNPLSPKLQPDGHLKFQIVTFWTFYYSGWTCVVARVVMGSATGGLPDSPTWAGPASSTSAWKKSTQWPSSRTRAASQGSLWQLMNWDTCKTFTAFRPAETADQCSSSIISFLRPFWSALLHSELEAGI